MPTFEIPVAIGTDDARADAEGVFSNATAFSTVGTLSGSTDHRFYERFLGLAIPRGNKIDSAVMRVKSNGTSTSVLAIEARLDASFTPAAPSDASFRTRAYTAARAAVTVPSTVVQDSFFDIDFAPALQEMVNKAGWAESGQNIGIIVQLQNPADTTPRRHFGSYESNPSTAPKIIVTHSAPVAAVTLPATDSFTAPDGTSLGERVSDSGHAWQTTGAWEISGNRVRQTDTSSPAKVAVVDAKKSNVDIKTEITLPAANSYVAGIAFRWVNADNYWRLALDSRATGGSLQLFQFANNSGTNKKQITIGGLRDAPVKLRAIVEGANLNVYVNDALVMTYDTLPTSDATRHGLVDFRTATGYDPLFFDNFYLADIAATGPYTATGVALGGAGTASGTAATANPASTTTGAATGQPGAATGAVQAPNVPATGAGSAEGQPGTASGATATSNTPATAEGTAQGGAGAASGQANTGAPPVYVTGTAQGESGTASGAGGTTNDPATAEGLAQGEAGTAVGASVAKGIGGAMTVYRPVLTVSRTTLSVTPHKTYQLERTEPRSYRLERRADE